MRGQLETALPDRGDGSPRLISATREVAEEARGMVLMVDDLFRLDVRPRADTLGTIVRNLTDEELTLSTGGYATGTIAAPGAAEGLSPLRPNRLDLAWSIGSTAVTATLATLRDPDRGVIRITAQAVVRSG